MRISLLFPLKDWLERLSCRRHDTWCPDERGGWQADLFYSIDLTESYSPKLGATQRDVGVGKRLNRTVGGCARLIEISLGSEEFHYGSGEPVGRRPYTQHRR